MRAMVERFYLSPFKDRWQAGNQGFGHFVNSSQSSL